MKQYMEQGDEMRLNEQCYPPRVEYRSKIPYMRIATVRSIYGPETYIQVPDWKWSEWREAIRTT